MQDPSFMHPETCNGAKITIRRSGDGTSVSVSCGSAEVDYTFAERWTDADINEKTRLCLPALFKNIADVWGVSGFQGVWNGAVVDSSYDEDDDVENMSIVFVRNPSITIEVK